MVRHQLIENRGASLWDHKFREGCEKGNKKKFSQERLCLLTCLLMGDPGLAFAPWLDPQHGLISAGS